MAVKQQMRPVPWPVRLCHDHGAAWRLVHLGVKAYVPQVRGQPVGGALAIDGMGGIRGNRRDRQQVAEATKRRVESVVDRVENAGQGHVVS